MLSSDGVEGCVQGHRASTGHIIAAAGNGSFRKLGYHILGSL